MITSRSRNSMSSSSTSTEASSSSSGSSDQPRQPRRRSAGKVDGSSSPPAVGATDDRFTQAEHRERDQVRTHGPSDEVLSASTPLRQRRLPASFWQEPNVPRRRVTTKSVNCDERSGKNASVFDGVRARLAARHNPSGLRTDSCCSDWNRMICYDALHSAAQPRHHTLFPTACNHGGTSFPAAELSSYFPGLQTTGASWTSGVRSGCPPAAPLTPPSPSVSTAFVGGDDVLSAYLRLCSCAASTPYDVTNKLDGGNADNVVDSMSCQLGRTLYYPLPAVLPSVRNLAASPLLAAAVSSDLTSCGAAHRTHRFHPYT